MRKLYCDRCGKEVDNLHEIKVPDPDKPIGYCSYNTKKVEVCNSCKDYIIKAVEEYDNSMIKVRFAFYETLFPSQVNSN